MQNMIVSFNFQMIDILLCSDSLPRAFVKCPTSGSTLPRKIWGYFVAQTKEDRDSTFSEIWIYPTRELYEGNGDHLTLRDISQGLAANGVRSGNLLLFKTRNEGA